MLVTSSFSQAKNAGETNSWGFSGRENHITDGGIFQFRVTPIILYPSYCSNIVNKLFNDSASVGWAKTASRSTV